MVSRGDWSKERMEGKSFQLLCQGTSCVCWSQEVDFDTYPPKEDPFFFFN